MEEADGPLVNDSTALRDRWEEIQTHFVDQPQGAVQEADDLVNDVIDELSKSFRDQRESLERGWRSGEDVSTEDLRTALQRYRSFFHRLVSV
jgi:hypothetical protein